MRAETQTTSLGRYRVVKRLANGGMADVLLARTDGIEGFERYIVIKRIHAALLDEPRYVKMFLDEARLAASLHHHNIVQVNDIGQEAGEYFFAMEYVHGEDARTLLVEASKRGQLIPIEHVITIITAAAAGLHYAHEQRAADRTPLGIVHRDVSPANILVGFDGSVKVADFGIALAAHRAEQTQSGVLKGKVAYMSPEQCNCERVDRRSDVFSLGVCLYELVTVHPCFTADNDFMTMSSIVAGKITKPSQLSPSVDLALEQIILKALAVNAADRFQSTDELRIALEDYAAAAGTRASTTALADYMREQFGTREMPWQEDAASAAVAASRDDDEPEISVTSPPPDDSQSIIIDDDIAVPIERVRPVKQTLPLRPVKMVIQSTASSPASAGMSSGSAAGPSWDSAGMSSGSAVGPSWDSAAGVSSGSAAGLSSDSPVGMSSDSSARMSPGSASGPSWDSAAGMSSGSAAGLSPDSPAGMSSGFAAAVSARSAAPMTSPDPAAPIAVASLRTEPVARVRPRDLRRLLILGAIAAALFAAIGIAFVLGTRHPKPARNHVPPAAPARRPALAPLPASTLTAPVQAPAATAPTATPAAAAPTKKQAGWHGSTKPATEHKAATPPKWDPDALFPK